MWYENKLKRVAKSEICKIHWNFVIQIDWVFEHNTLGQIVVDKVNQMYSVIYIVCPINTKIVKKEDEK